MERNRQQRFDRIDLEAAGRQLGRRGEGPGLGPVGLTLRPAFLARVDQGDHLDIGIVEVGRGR